MKYYYHVIEEGHYNDIGSHGYYDTIEEAKVEADRLADFFPELNFYVYPSNSNREPEFCTI
jgi:hypothetical protein